MLHARLRSRLSRWVGLALAVWGAGPGFAGTTIIRVETEGHGAVLGVGNPPTCNLNGAVVWDGSRWVVNTTWAHKYFVDVRTGQRLKSYTVVEFAGTEPTGVVHVAPEFQVVRSHVAPDPARPGVLGVRYLIRDPHTDKELVLQSVPFGAAGRARFDLFFENFGSTVQTTAIRGGGQWLTYPMRAQQAATQPLRGAERSGELATAGGWYFFDVGGGADMGGVSFELLMVPGDPAGVQVGGGVVGRFSLKWMDESGALHELRFTPALVTPQPATEPVSFAGVARTAGANATRWHSEAVVHNPTAAPVDAGLELRARDSGALVATRVVTLPAGATARIPDLYSELGAPDGAGLLRLGGGARAWVRTFNQGSGGTFGQDVPAVNPTAALPPGVARVFPVSTPADAAREFRSNLLLTNFSEADAVCTLASGGASRTVSVTAGAYRQVGGVGAFLGVSPGVAVVTVTCDRSWAATVSTIDPVLGDPTTVRGAAPEPHTLQRFAGVASVSGAGGTQWRSEVVLYNVLEEVADVSLALSPIRAKDPTHTTTLRLARREVRRLPDLYAALGAPAGSGMLTVKGPVLAWVRTFNQGASATFGQDVPMLPASGTRPGVEVLFPVSTPADIARQPRSNLLLYNYEGRDTTVTVRSGTVSRTVVLAPGVYDQLNNVGAWLGLPPGWGTVTVSADGFWVGTVSTVDAPLGDPTTVLGLVR